MKRYMTLAMIAAAVLIVAVCLCSCTGSSSHALKQPASQSEESSAGYTPDYQDETTNLSAYYENDGNGYVLPTAANQHDVGIIGNGGEDAASLKGTWKIDESTIYVFDGIDRGLLKTAVDNYTFTYSAQKGKLRIDIDVENGINRTYDYQISGDQMSWTNEDHTFQLMRVEE